MSDEKPPLENHSRAEPAAGDANVSVSSTKNSLPPAVALAFVIIALLGVLIVMVLRGNKGGSASGAPELTQLQAEANALRTQLNNERVAMGLRPLEGGSESVEEIAGRLKKDADTMVALAASFQAMLADKDIEIKAKNAEILRLEQLRESFAAESKRLNDELQRALVSGSGADLLRRDFDGMKAQRDALATELASVREELAAKGKGVSADDFADLQRRYDETLRAKEFFEAKVKELEGDLSKAKLFASSENELLPAAVELFRSLRLLEGKADSEIATEYSSLGVKLGANVLHTLNFATGSSVLTPADDELIRNLVADIPDGDLVLAIGYASETGNVDSNRVLSSDRATAAATLFSSVKRPTQLVQAVYLGQTDRFSSRIPERNQIVEIWRIRKK
jgi:outer membrane protein OmpA-like peptidoglycan-associated protein